MRYRGSSKIKMEHSVIKGLEKLLQKIEAWEEVRSIIPGRIKPAKNSTHLHMTVQYITKTGIKCLAFSDGAVQEVFIVCSSKEEIEERIISL